MTQTVQAVGPLVTWW